MKKVLIGVFSMALTLGFLAQVEAKVISAGCGEDVCLPSDFLFIAEGQGCPNQESMVSKPSKDWAWFYADPKRVDPEVACSFFYDLYKSILLRNASGQVNVSQLRVEGFDLVKVEARLKSKENRFNLANGASLVCPLLPILGKARIEYDSSGTTGNSGEGKYDLSLCEKTQHYLYEIETFGQLDAKETSNKSIDPERVKNYVDYLCKSGRGYPFPGNHGEPCKNPQD